MILNKLKFWILLPVCIVLFHNVKLLLLQKLTEEELNSLDELYKIVCPERDSEKENPTNFDEVLSAAADHIQALLDSKNKEVFGTTCILS